MAEPPDQQPLDQQLKEQVLGLAAICQCVALVDDIARTGNADPAALETCLKGLFSFAATAPSEVYGGAANLEYGLRRINDILSDRRSTNDREVIRYMLGVTHLQRELLKQQDTAAIVRSRLEHVEKGISLNNKNFSELSSSISAIYKDTISHFRFRLKVNGSAQKLQNEFNADRIRALLLAAIRAAYLWRQTGGRRLHLLIKKGKILAMVRELLQREIPH